MLAANGVSREIRGQLQSHGLAGIQARHYDGYDYMPEKRQALEKLFTVLRSRSGASGAVAKGSMDRRKVPSGALTVKSA